MRNCYADSEIRVEITQPSVIMVLHEGHTITIPQTKVIIFMQVIRRSEFSRFLQSIVIETSVKVEKRVPVRKSWRGRIKSYTIVAVAPLLVLRHERQCFMYVLQWLNRPASSITIFVFVLCATYAGPVA